MCNVMSFTGCKCVQVCQVEAPVFILSMYKFLVNNYVAYFCSVGFYLDVFFLMNTTTLHREYAYKLYQLKIVQ